MSTKRYTDATKWSDPWFQDLPVKYKLLWLYLIDKCDHAGIYKYSKRQLEFDLEMKLDLDDVMKHFTGRIAILNDEKWFLIKFIKFQYGVLNPDNNCHKSAIKILKEEGLYEGVLTTLPPPNEGVRRDMAGQMDMDIKNENKNGNGNENGRTERRNNEQQRKGALDPEAELFSKAIAITKENLSLTQERRQVMRDIRGNVNAGADKFLRAVKNMMKSSWPNKTVTYFTDKKFDAINRIDHFANSPPRGNGFDSAHAPLKQVKTDIPNKVKYDTPAQHGK